MQYAALSAGSTGQQGQRAPRYMPRWEQDWAELRSFLQSQSTAGASSGGKARGGHRCCVLLPGAGGGERAELVPAASKAPLFIYHQSHISSDVTENMRVRERRKVCRAGWDFCATWGTATYLLVLLLLLTMLQGHSPRGRPALDLLREAELAQMQPPWWIPGWHLN